MQASTARRGALALLLAALILFVLGSIEMARAATHAVEISDFAFSPATLTITVGDTVTWTNSDPVVHTATSTTGAFDSGRPRPRVSRSASRSRRPARTTTSARPHPTMTGQIVVQAAAAATPVAVGGGPIPDVAMATDGRRTSRSSSGSCSWVGRAWP